MKKEGKKNTESQLLDLLKKVLPKAVEDQRLVGRIYQAVEQELKAKSRFTAFEVFCSKVELPDLEPQSLDSIKDQFAISFGKDADITLKPDRKEKTLAVEVGLPDGTQFTGEVKVNPDAGKEDDGEQEVKFRFIPFPVCMPGDKELVWMLARKENLSPEEAGISLHKIEDEFWASKAGQKLIRDRVEKSFPEFIARVQGGKLTELGLKRHYKTPEPIKIMRKK
jgi:hypothetical protein